MAFELQVTFIQSIAWTYVPRVVFLGMRELSNPTCTSVRISCGLLESIGKSVPLENALRFHMVASCSRGERTAMFPQTSLRCHVRHKSCCAWYRSLRTALVPLRFSGEAFHLQSLDSHTFFPCHHKTSESPCSRWLADSDDMAIMGSSNHVVVITSQGDQPIDMTQQHAKAGKYSSPR
jgi:hypothetical protein